MTPRALRRFLLLIVAGLLAPPSARGQSATPGEPGYLTHTFVWENDAPFGTDQHYTNGLRYTRAIAAPPVWVHRMRRHPFWKALVFGAEPCGYGAGTACYDVRTGYAFGQNLYTPRDIGTRVRQPDDRPYGAMLYYGRTFELVRGRWQHELEYDAGITGPLALGESVQVGWHDLWGFTTPSGWHHQLRSGPLVQGIARTHYQLARLGAPGSSFSADLLPRVQLVAGTPITSARGGAILRVGRGVPALVASSQIPVHVMEALALAALSTKMGDSAAVACACDRANAARPDEVVPGEALPRDAAEKRQVIHAWQLQSLTQRQAARRPRDRRPRPLYAFIAADVTGVAHNALLQGVPLRDDNPPAPPMERVFTEVQAGATAQVFGAEITIRRLWRSAEFQGDETHRTWTLGVTW